MPRGPKLCKMERLGVTRVLRHPEKPGPTREKKKTVDGGKTHSSREKLLGGRDLHCQGDRKGRKPLDEG